MEAKWKQSDAKAFYRASAGVVPMGPRKVALAAARIPRKRPDPGKDHRSDLEEGFPMLVPTLVLALGADFFGALVTFSWVG